MTKINLREVAREILLGCPPKLTLNEQAEYLEGRLREVVKGCVEVALCPSGYKGEIIEWQRKINEYIAQAIKDKYGVGK